MKICKKIIVFISLLYILNAQLSISYLRFYASDKDFISDVRLLATHRFDRAHLQVFYNSNKIPILKEWVDIKGDVYKREYLEHSEKIYDCVRLRF